VEAVKTAPIGAAVVGAGPTGLATALALAKSGVATTIVAPPYNAAQAAMDKRTSALMGPSIDLLRNLGAWELCEGSAAGITAVRLVDALGGILRSPETMFTAAEAGLASFGANIANPRLVQALHAAVLDCPDIRWVATAGVTGLTADDCSVRLDLAEGVRLEAQMAVAADGRGSTVREAAGIPVRQWAYPQAAVVACFTHTRGHAGVVTELHRRAGPLTTVPLPGRSSSLVWVEGPEEARRLMGLSDAEFGEELQVHLAGILGEIVEVEPRALYPLGGAAATRMTARRIALVGEAAHVVPPIGAQGLNLGLRDAAALAECAGQAAPHGLGARGMLAAYERMRAGDVALRSAAIDMLNRSLLVDFLPLALVRTAALHAIGGSRPMRQLLMRIGMGSAAPLPRLMRPNAVVP
jgi:2-octaprenyl-6-methoxyphenol hydroxylase